KTWRNLLLLVVILAIAGAYYYFYMPSQKPDFSQDYANLSDSWKASGVELENLHSDVDKITALSESKIMSLKASLEEYKKSATLDETKDLIDAYVPLLDVSLTLKKIDEKMKVTDDAALPFCEKVDTYKEIINLKKSLIDQTQKYLDEVNDFVDKYPDKADSIEMYWAEDILEDDEYSLANEEEILQLMAETC
ncbi:MAG: hypothetical protein Q8N60_05960, partial [Candidatus Diapherotrites archaeon]|nr:hypothetical protein [Candidatus Diapherotrites archaeon]